MNRKLSWLMAFVCFAVVCHVTFGQENFPEKYPAHPDSVRQADVPEGELKGPYPWKSNIFPGTVRDYWVYVPAQYDASKPACDHGVKRCDTL